MTGRLRDQWHADGGYRRTLIAALSAITATVLPHPAIAAALGATLAQRTPRSRYRPVSGPRFDLDGEFDDDPDPDLDEEDPAPGPLVRDPWRPSPPWSSRNLD